MPHCNFEGPLFMGSGQTSLAHVGHLHLRFAYALDKLGEIQQPYMSTEPSMTDRARAQIEGDEMEVEKIAKEIYVALTGKAVVSTKPFKYGE
jgi:hypothetical protein